MEQLIGMRSNILFTQEKNDKGKRVFKKHHELIFITDSAEYERSTENSTDLVRTRKLTTHRFTVSDDVIPQLMAMLVKASKADPTEAK